VVTPLRDTGIDCAIISVTDCSQLGHLGMVHLTESVINTDRSEGLLPHSIEQRQGRRLSYKVARAFVTDA
jgi:hypothetical protein